MLPALAAICTVFYHFPQILSLQISSGLCANLQDLAVCWMIVNSKGVNKGFHPSKVFYYVYVAMTQLSTNV